MNLLEDRTDRWVRPNLHVKGRERGGVGVGRVRCPLGASPDRPHAKHCFEFLPKFGILVLKDTEKEEEKEEVFCLPEN